MRQVGIGAARLRAACAFLHRDRRYPATIRILFATDSIQDPPTGVGRAAATWLSELQGLGVTVATLDHREDAKFASGERHVLPARTRRLTTALWHFDLLRRIAKARIAHDVLVLPSGFPCVIGSHPRLVLFVHDLSALDAGHYRAGKRLWFRAFWARSLRKARLLVCVSEHTRSQLLARVPGLDAARTVVVHNAIGASWASRLHAAANAPASRREHLLCVGTLEARKNLPRVLDAYARVVARGPTPPLVLAGRRGHEAERILARAGAPDLRDKVRFVEAPSEQDLVQLYANARALIFASLDEGFGLPLLEAMAAGCAILTSDVAALPEIAGPAALLVSPTDTDQIANGLLQIAQDDALCDRLAALGATRIAEFASTTLARRLLSALEAIA